MQQFLRSPKRHNVIKIRRIVLVSLKIVAFEVIETDMLVYTDFFSQEFGVISNSRLITTCQTVGEFNSCLSKEMCYAIQGF